MTIQDDTAYSVQSSRGPILSANRSLSRAERPQGLIHSLALRIIPIHLCSWLRR